MTASSHAEIVMTMMEMAPQRRSAEPAHNGFNSFFNGQTVCFFLGHCSMFARIQILRGKMRRSRWQGALMTISWWQWWKWPWVQFLSNGQTVCFFLRHCGVFIYWRATLLAFKNYMVKWKDDRELSWWDRDDDDGNGPAETLSRARAQWVQFLFKLPHWVHVVLSGGCWHVRRLWCTR